MIEIKFRALRTDGQGFAYGYVYKGIPETDLTYIMPEEIYNGYEAETNHGGKQEFTLRFEKYHEVKPETVGQLVKIVGDLKIWEGDIVLAHSHNANYPLKYVVVYNEHRAAFRLRWVGRFDKGMEDETGFYDLYIEPDRYKSFKILGNLHQNPDLLTK
jgi:hypothetical protein